MNERYILFYIFGAKINCSLYISIFIQNGKNETMFFATTKATKKKKKPTKVSLSERNSQTRQDKAK